MATVPKAQTLNLTRHSSYVLQEANCDTEVARQPVLVRVIKTEMASQEFRVRVELIEIHEVSERYPHIGSKTSKSTKEMIFFSGCCMAQRRSLSGRSPFCQRKLSDSRKFNGNLFLESNNINHKQKTQNTPTTMQSPRECRDG